MMIAMKSKHAELLQPPWSQSRIAIVVYERYLFFVFFFLVLVGCVALFLPQTAAHQASFRTAAAASDILHHHDSRTATSNNKNDNIRGGRIPFRCLDAAMCNNSNNNNNYNNRINRKEPSINSDTELRPEQGGSNNPTTLLDDHRHPLFATADVMMVTMKPTSGQNHQRPVGVESSTSTVDGGATASVSSSSFRDEINSNEQKQQQPSNVRRRRIVVRAIPLKMLPADYVDESIPVGIEMADNGLVGASYITLDDVY